MNTPIFKELISFPVLWFAISIQVFAQDTESLKKELLEIREESQQSKLYNALALAYLNHLPDSSLYYAQIAQKNASKYNQKDEIARSHQITGNIYHNQGLFKSAIEHFIKSLDYYKEIGNERGQAEVYRDLGLAYHYSKKMDVALENYEKAIELFRKTHDLSGEAGTLSYIGHVYEKKSEYEKALGYQEKALAVYEKNQDTKGLANVMDNIGSIYEDQKDYEKAFRYFSKALQYNREANNQISAIIDLNNIGDIYQKQGKYKESLQYTLESLALARKLNQKYQLRSAYRDLGQTHQLMGDYEKAYQYLDSSYAIYGEIYNSETASQIAHMQVLYGIQEKDKEIALLESSEQFSRILIIVFIAGITVLILLGLIIFNRQRLLILKNKQIYETQRDLQEAAVENLRLNELNLKAEIENKRLKEELLEDELQIKSRELTSRTLMIVKKNEILNEIKENLRSISLKKELDREQELKKLISHIDQNTQSEKDWNEFQMAFEKVHGNFFTKLQEHFPDLTSGDLRLCALLRLNLSTKDMATTMGISYDSLRVNRYRLRKKLNLKQGDNLVHFMMGV